MDRVISWLMQNLTAFFAWWADKTGTETKHYDHWPHQVNWPIVSFVIFLWVLLIVIDLIYIWLS